MEAVSSRGMSTSRWLTKVVHRYVNEPLSLLSLLVTASTNSLYLFRSMCVIRIPCDVLDFGRGVEYTYVHDNREVCFCQYTLPNNPYMLTRVLLK